MQKYAPIFMVYISDTQPFSFKGPQDQIVLRLQAAQYRLYKE
jgi:hypothetical protein